jgi:hypothetical protein
VSDVALTGLNEENEMGSKFPRLAFVAMALTASAFALGSARDANASRWALWQIDHNDFAGNIYESAVLFDIPWGVSWEAACQSKPGLFNERPTYCESMGFPSFYMKGVWKIPWTQYNNGMYWSGPKKISYGPGTIELGMVLERIPWGVSWEKTCAVTPGLLGRVPDSCVNTMWHIEGRWFFPCTDCRD